MSEEAKTGAAIRQSRLGEATFERNAFVDKAEEFSSLLDWLPPDKQTEVTMAIEEKKINTDQLRKLGLDNETIKAVRHYSSIRKDAMNRVWQKLNDRKLIKAYIQDYVSHIWKDPQKASKVLSELLQKRPLSGSKYITKPRT